jgi:hypothetical protein
MAEVFEIVADVGGDIAMIFDDKYAHDGNVSAGPGERKPFRQTR